MSWLLFLDESGHDQRTTPYEVRGGVAIHASRLWEFVQAVRTLEQSLFGVYLHETGSEIKGCKLLARSRFAWEKQGPRFDPQALRKHALNFLNAPRQGKQPRRDEFTAFGQACIGFVERIIGLLHAHGAVIFAAMVPHVPRPAGVGADFPRKDMVFLLERFFYFLRRKDDTGLLVMDRSDKSTDRDLAARMERYFTGTSRGMQRAQWVIPTPFFVESDMAYGVQAADVCIDILNHGRRLHGMTEPVRDEIRDFANLLEHLEWHSREARGAEEFNTHSVFFVRDPYQARQPGLWEQK